MQNIRLISPYEGSEEGYSQQELVEFLNYLKAKNLVKAVIVNSWSTAISNLLRDISESECNDVRTVDIDLAVHKAANKASNKISPSSLRSYRARTKRAIEEFVSWKSDPANYRPLNFKKPQTHSSFKHTSKSKIASASIQANVNGNSAQHLASEDLSQLSALNLSYPLRSGFLAQIVIPRDLSQLEAKGVAHK